MIVTVKRSSIKGAIDANPSKSYTQRAYALAALANSPSIIRYPSWSDDGKVALEIARCLGAEVEIDGDIVRIAPGKQEVMRNWFAGESGLSLRMFSPIAALQNQTINIDGHGTLRNRPVGFIKETLEQMGAIVLTEGTLPLQITGPLQSGSYHIDGSFSSQLLTGLLIAAPMIGGQVIYNVSNLKSTPYIDMTLQMIREFGGGIEVNDEYSVFIAKHSGYRGAEVAIEADWSGLAFIIVAAAIAGDGIFINNVTAGSLQADCAILHAMDQCGGRYTFRDNGIEIEQVSQLKGFAIDATNCPDLFPPLAAMAARCTGESRIAGVHRLKHKETDRASAIVSEFNKIGVSVQIQGDEMVIQGTQSVRGGRASSLGDHRMAMALACLGLVADEPVVIEKAESVAKSYPGFYNDLRQLDSIVVVPQ